LVNTKNSFSLKGNMPKTVSVVIPCLNEEKTIQQVLDALYSQTYPIKLMEIVIADGGSTDRTREVIATYQNAHPDLELHLVENPKRIIPAGVNAAILASTGEIIVRMDAHSIPQSDYVERCVAGLESGLGDNVGGRWDIMPSNEGWIARSIALAAGHPIGVGDAQYRHSSTAAVVDTVPYGSFFRSLLDKVGLFDETLIANEDYEFNTRIRQAGGTIWFDPEIRCQYFARPNLNRLARQYWTYGFWKLQMLRRYPNTIRWRQFLPPAFLLGLLVLAIVSIFFRPALFVLLAIIAIYSLILLLVGVQQWGKEKDIAYVIGVPLAIATMHFSWAAGFLVGIFSAKVKPEES